VFLSKLLPRDESVKSKRASSPSHKEGRGVHGLVTVKDKKKEEQGMSGNGIGPMPGARMTFV
jgi:hypothetical protein